MDVANGKVVTLNEFQPVTFAERGVVVGFTKPDLFLSRIRPIGNGSMELLVRNIAGGKGYYVLNWRGLAEAIPLTLYDNVLYQAISAAPSIDPTTIRRASIAIAKDGYAGQGAATAAATLESRDHDLALLTQFGLIARLLSASGVKNVSLISVAAATPAEHEKLRHAIRRLAPELGADPVDIFKIIDQLADALFPIGMADAPMPGRLRQTLHNLRQFCKEMTAWADEEKTDMRAAALFIASAAEINASIVEKLVADIDAQLDNIVAFVMRWITAEKAMREVITRSGWVLDGWDHLINLWQIASGEDRHQQRVAVEEISLLVPAIPREGLDWLKTSIVRPGDRVIQRRWVKANEDWRSAVTTLGRVARNEKLLASRS